MGEYEARRGPGRSRVAKENRWLLAAQGSRRAGFHQGSSAPPPRPGAARVTLSRRGVNTTKTDEAA
ncbi:hypothetical protein E2C01_064085 [Portunus trituberculatus]|uniref:Uncharacterized protein n=1 Tax=Portunus trituberculatus TaxID=210409 RepID=A0A5B7HMT3_PORTR|nr:hypothetical protein [Portunus trituberculatus]